jgi:hypothetical protein
VSGSTAAAAAHEPRAKNNKYHVQRPQQQQRHKKQQQQEGRKEMVGVKWCVKRFKSHNSKSPPNNIDSFNILLCD